MTGNLDIWNALKTPDPKHTKPFSRSGGFKGTSIKPIYCDLQMTEQFGPCGIGWGMTKPEFQVVTAGNEILVYCTVALWHGKPDNLVYGVGGDKVSAARKDGPFNSDEAFKAAYTDALSNAMKHIGMSADVHMGRFDDDKYVRELRERFDGDEREPEQTDEEYVSGAIAWMKQQVDAATIYQAWTAETERYHTLPTPLQQKLLAGRDEALARFAPKADAAPADDWKLVADTIKREIDTALDTVAIRDILESKNFADLEAHSKSAAAFLRDRANKRAGVIAQGGRRAA